MATKIQSVERTLRILEASAANPQGIGLGQLAELLHTSVATTHNFVASLADEGYLSQAYRRGPYSPGPRLVALAGSVQSMNDDLALAATAEMRRFQESADETLHLSVLMGRLAVDVLFLESSQPIRFSTVVGRSMPLHASAAGKVLIAWRPPEEIERLVELPLRGYTPNTITDQTTLYQELSRIAGQGYAVNLGELDPGLRCIAGPIRNAAGEVVATLSMSAPEARYPGSSVLQLRELIADTVARISAKLRPGYRTADRHDLPSPELAGLDQKESQPL